LPTSFTEGDFFQPVRFDENPQGSSLKSVYSKKLEEESIVPHIIVLFYFVFGSCLVGSFVNLFDFN